MAVEHQCRCVCGMPERWANCADFPVEFDESVNEYHLAYGAKRRMHHIMRYCFWCGGRLPESTRNELFTQPDEAEAEEVQTLLTDAKSRADVFRILGEPDASHDWDDESESCTKDAISKWTRSFTYSTRWKTLDLTVFERPDGSVGYCWGGKYIGKPADNDRDVDCRKKRWWEFWR